MTLHKVVTYRSDYENLCSSWNDFPIKTEKWNEFLLYKYNRVDSSMKWTDYWN